jgi:hypothetical protein
MGLDDVVKKKSSLYWDSNPGTVDHPARNQSFYGLRYPGSCEQTWVGIN